MSIVFQQYNLYPHKTALANIMMAPVHVLKEDPREAELIRDPLAEDLRVLVEQRVEDVCDERRQEVDCAHD